MNIPNDIYIVGAGGVTSWLLPPLLKTLKSQLKDPPQVTIYDGDMLEVRNLERQLFTSEAANQSINKAEALVKQYQEEYPKLAFVPDYFHDGAELPEHSLIFICVDNHPARIAALTACDRVYGSAIIAANEYTDSQAIRYSSFDKGEAVDPRICYPEMLEDESGDPRRPMGCATEEALKAAPQLAIANFTAAAYALQLFWFYHAIVPKMDVTSKEHWPIQHSNNFNKTNTRTEKDYGNRNGVEDRAKV